MRYALLFVLTLASSFSRAIGQDQPLFEKKAFTSLKGTSLPYRILLPENYDKGKKYPLVLFLHGAGERGSDNERQLVHGSKLFLADSNRKNFPAIVVFPQCSTEGWWSSVQVDRNKEPLEFTFDYSKPVTASLESAIELTKQLTKDLKVDKNRIYITGMSMGGMGTFEAVAREPKLFAAAAPICGGGDTKSYNASIAKVPFWVFHGADDPVVNVKLSRDMVEKLKSLSATVKYTEYPGVGHDSWNNAFAEPDFLKWLFSNKK
jgi:predicted peptidase